MKHWYALFTKPRREFQVSEVLGEKDLETYVPAIRVRRRGKTVERPFFPRYMFVRVDFEEIGLSEVQWAPGLTRIVSLGGVPTRVPEAMVRQLRRRLRELNSEGVYSPFRKGAQVRIKSGPLRDFEAVFDTHLSSADRVRVLVKVLGNLRRAEIDVEDIELVGSDGR